jgi:outer membrane protein assembly factor BamB
MAVNQPASNSSFVQGLGISSGKVTWQSAALNSTQLAELELRVQHNVVLATNAAADGIIAFDAHNGTQLWNRSGSFCRTPSPIADVYRGELLLSESCENLSGLNMVDVVTGKELWSGWSAPSSAVPLGNCSSVNQAAEHIVFGCSCWHGKSAQQPGKGAAADSRGPATAASRTSSSRRQGKAAAAAAVGVSTHSANGVCLYAISSRNGKLRWALPLVGNASFPAAAQQWDMAPLIHANMVVFLATDRVIAVDLLSGKLRWVLPLPKGEVLRPYEQPVVDADSSTLVLAAQVAGSNKTGLSGVSLKEGRLLWHKTVNGTVQRGAGPEDRAQELMVTGGRVYVEACRGSRCCLRALNVTTGKQRWGMCLDAVQGDDATHPHAQFAIWFITLLTIASIALLILGAGLVYLQRW